jgi:hypothetical protein
LYTNTNGHFSKFRLQSCHDLFPKSAAADKHVCPLLERRWRNCLELHKKNLMVCEEKTAVSATKQEGLFDWLMTFSLSPTFLLHRTSRLSPKDMPKKKHNLIQKASTRYTIFVRCKGPLKILPPVTRWSETSSWIPDPTRGISSWCILSRAFPLHAHQVAVHQNPHPEDA